MPRSRAAVEWAEAWFRAAEGDRNIRWSGPFSEAGSGAGQDDEIGIAGSADGDCVEENSFENPCLIDAVIVDPGDDDSGGGDPWDPGDDDSGGDDPCYNCYGDEDPGGGGWNPGDSDGCDPDAIDGPESCQEVCDENGGIQDGCSLSPLQLNRIDAAIDQIFTAAECSALVQALRDYRSSNTLLGHNTAFSSDHGHFHWREKITVHHVGAFTNDKWLRYVLAHEGGHHMEFVRAIERGKTFEEAWEAGRDEDKAHEWAEKCTGLKKDVLHTG